MLESILGLTGILGYLFKIIVVIITVLIIAFMFLSYNTNLETKEIERFQVELYENIVGSKLTDYRVVFDKQKLDAYDMKLTEPYVRHCEYAYRMKVETLSPEFNCTNNNDCKDFCESICGIAPGSIQFPADAVPPASINCMCSNSETCSCKKNGRFIKKPEWEFGFTSGYLAKTEDKTTNTITRTFPAAINVLDPKRPAEGYEDVIPARVTLKVYDYWISRILCTAESAYLQKKKVTMWIPCLKPTTTTSYPGKKVYYECGFPLRRKDDNSNSKEVCLYEEWLSGTKSEYDTDQCRETDVPLFKFSHTYSPAGDNGERILKAIPVKASEMPGFTAMANGKNSHDVCNDLSSIHRNYIANGEPVGIVVLCFGLPGEENR